MGGCRNQNFSLDGSVRTVLWNFATILAADEKTPVAAIAQGYDITERRRAEEALCESERVLRENESALKERNEELIRFTYAVSHDLKSPLVTIQTFLGYLEQDIRKPDAARMEKDLGYIRTAADKMGRLLDELLELSRVGRKMNPPVEVPLQAIVKEALDLVAGRIAERGVQVEVTEEPVVLYGDRPRLVEVFQNLVDNAVKFMGDQPAPRVEIGVEQAGEEMVLFVRDNGIGIDPRYQPKLFGLFEKLDPGTEGTGIGLALVKRIVEVHGGRIWVESEGLGKGTTFRFTLAKTQTTIQRRRRAIMIKGEPIVILLVEDDPAHAEIVRRNLGTSAWPTGSSTWRTARRRWTTSSARAPTPTPRPAPGRTSSSWTCACPRWTAWRCCAGSRRMRTSSASRRSC